MTETTNDVTQEGGEATFGELEKSQPQNTEEQTTDAPAEPEQTTTESSTEEATQDDGADQSTDSEEQVEEKFEVSVPDTMNLPETTIAALTEAAQAKGISSEQAQAMLDAIAPTLAEANAQVVESTKKEWAEAVANDPELGGPKLNENMAIADKFVETFGDEGVKELLNDGDLPLGKEPRLFAMLVKAGRAITEDSALQGGTTAKPNSPITGDVRADADRAAALMYPDNPS